MKNAVTVSEINTWLSCRLQHYFKYVECLADEEESFGPRKFGTLIHEVVERFHNGEPKDGLKKKLDRFFDNRIANVLFTDRVERLWKYWGLSLGLLAIQPRDMSFLICEQVFDLPIAAYRNKRVYTHRSCRFAGKMDGVLAGIGSLSPSMVYELKTTSNFGSAFLNNLRISWQPSAYLWAARRLYGVSHLAVVRYEILNTECLLRLKRSQTHEELRDEVAISVVNRPDRYRLLHDVIRTNDDLRRFEQLLYDMADEITAGQRIWPNPEYHNCNYCAFKLECETGVILEGSSRKSAKHVELLGACLLEGEKGEGEKGEGERR